MKLFQDVLREYRKSQGKTQAEMAKILNVKQQTYCNYERGKRKPDMDILIKMAEQFKISLDVLTGRYE